MAESMEAMRKLLQQLAKKGGPPAPAQDAYAAIRERWRKAKDAEESSDSAVGAIGPWLARKKASGEMEDLEDAGLRKMKWKARHKGRKASGAPGTIDEPWREYAERTRRK